MIFGSEIVGTGMLTDTLIVGYGFGFPGDVELQFNTSVTIGLTPGILGQWGRSVPLISRGLKSMGPPML